MAGWVVPLVVLVVGCRGRGGVRGGRCCCGRYSADAGELFTVAGVEHAFGLPSFFAAPRKWMC